MSEQSVRVLVFSDDVDTRQAVIDGVGVRASKDSPSIEWTQAATPFGVRELIEGRRHDLMILDADASKEGGMSVARDLENTIEDLPPFILLISRQQDEWLATSFGAAATVLAPIDPLALQETVAEVLASIR
ncbi:hypothetical protein M3T53_04320 [Actinomyces sp. B33]|uniref:hypothetical protein n=1 Tax=Actinomyces sp. B33 TaxID=2942131 RepID=UPI0023404B71|nr:hypothetical protein [Actinomyces sp. B33]MDC4232936.1 hypothetical protein [Actinomyces sp. B33]